MKEDMNKCKHCGYLIEPMKGCGLGKDALDRVKRSQRDIIYISFAQGKRDNLQSVPSVVGSITFVIHPWVFLTAALGPVDGMGRGGKAGGMLSFSQLLKQHPTPDSLFLYPPCALSIFSASITVHAISGFTYMVWNIPN